MTMFRIISLASLCLMVGSLLSNAQVKEEVMQESNNHSFNSEYRNFQNNKGQKEEVNELLNEIITTSSTQVGDGAYDRVQTKQKMAIPYDNIREADVFWSKRIWREIDVREKMNLIFSAEEQPLIAVLFEILRNNPDVQLFADDEFTEELSIEQVVSKLHLRSKVDVYDENADDYINQEVTNAFNPDEYKKFRLKEDWIFDEERGGMVVRIIGLAPIRNVYDENGNKRGQEALFWMHYPEVRQHLARYDSYNPLNDAIRLSWDSIFEMRYFSSRITKESNVDGKRVEDYETGKSALLESEEIERRIFNMEHDMWSY